MLICKECKCFYWCYNNSLCRIKDKDIIEYELDILPNEFEIGYAITEIPHINHEDTSFGE